MSVPFILPLVQATDLTLVGGKAINLAVLLQAGFPVPDGFVVTTEAFRQAGRGPQRSVVEEAIRHAYRAWAENSKGKIHNPPVAVRSSATAEDMAGASMAGQYETYLDIVGEEAVIEAVKKCWASLSTPRTQAYLREHKIDPATVAMAVVVQELVPAQVAGVMFTANPQNGNEREILIEASYGLGEAVVSGLVQPDTVVLDRDSGAIKSYRVGTKEVAIHPGTHAAEAVSPELRRGRCLTAENLADLRELAVRAHAHFGRPQDAEWAIDGAGKLFMLQSRAVTTLGAVKTRGDLLEENRQALRAAKSRGRGDWARHNLGETLPHPTPLTWSVLRRFMTPAGGFGRMYALAGYSPSAALAQEGFLDLVAGRIYMDLTRAPEMFFPHFPFHYDTDLLRSTPSAAQAAPTIPAGSLLAQLRVGRRLKRAAKSLAALAENFDLQLDREIIPQLHRWIAEESRRDLAAFSADDWLATWRRREARIMDEFAPQSLLPSLICGMALENLRGFLAPHLWNHAGDDPEELANLLAAGGPADATLRSNDALYRVATGSLPLEAWLQENGHRAPDELDLAAPRWRERPDAAKTLAQHLLGGTRPGDEHHRRREEADRRVTQLKSHMSRCEQTRLDAHVDLARRYLRFREDGKHELMRGYELLRQMVLDAGRRLALPPHDVCLLTFEELAAALRGAGASSGGDLRSLIESRRTRRLAESRIPLPDVIGPGEIESLGELLLPAHTQRMPAFGISSGACAGPVRIVASPESADDLGASYVLVCHSTDPSWTPLFVNAAGIVLECGGSLSHGAVVAREMGKPAVVLPNATRLLRDHQQIAVDGTGGFVLLTPDPGEIIDNQNAPTEDPDDIRIPFARVPPPPGRREQIAASLRNVSLIVWVAFLTLVFFVPQSHLRDASTRALDVILWPLVKAFGGPITVAVIAASLAALSMLGQWLLTDTPRLREARRRAAALRKAAAGLPPGSRRRKALLSLAAPVQTRLTLAAFVPLAVLLGPMVMSFLWIPQRIDPAVQNPRPGATAIVSAVVDGEYSGPVTLKAPALKVDPQTQAAASIRPTLANLAHELQDGKVPPTLQLQITNSGKSSAVLLVELEKFLGAPMPPQTLTWALETENHPAVWHINVAPGDGPSLDAALILGDIAPPLASMETDDKGNRFQQIAASTAGPLRALRIRYTDSRRQDPRPFFAPFASVGWHYDFGWLGVYLLVYIAVLFPLRFLLCVP